MTVLIWSLIALTFLLDIYNEGIVNALIIWVLTIVLTVGVVAFILSTVSTGEIACLNSSSVIAWLAVVVNLGNVIQRLSNARKKWKGNYVD